jgi:hypothetical protein
MALKILWNLPQQITYISSAEIFQTRNPDSFVKWLSWTRFSYHLWILHSSRLELEALSPSLNPLNPNKLRNLECVAVYLHVFLNRHGVSFGYTTTSYVFWTGYISENPWSSVEDKTVLWDELPTKAIRALSGEVLYLAMMESRGGRLWLDEGGLLLHNWDPPTGGDSLPVFFFSFLSFFIFIYVRIIIHWLINMYTLFYLSLLISFCCIFL